MPDIILKEHETGSAVPSPRHPSYVDFDPIIDVEWLKSLDSLLRDRLARRIARARDLQFYTGPFLLDGRASDLPGPRLVYLSRSEQPESYYDLDRTELWRPAEGASEFPELMEFIASLPFEATGRMLIIYDEGGREVPAHRDHDDTSVCHEFLWLRTNREKPFYLLDRPGGEKLWVNGHSAWFDTVNQYHGAGASGGLSFSIRVDGRFSDSLRSRISWRAGNRAATPACWAGPQAGIASPTAKLQ